MRSIPPASRVRALLQRTDYGAPVVVHGWVRTRRDSKAGFSFLEINDGSSLKGIQAVAGKDLPNYDSEVLRLTTGCSVRIEGTLAESPGKGQAVEIAATRVEPIGFVEEPETYPLQKKRHTLEHLREIAHLRPRSNTIGAVMRVRNALADATHRFFQERDFLYVHTPIVTASDCEGAGRMFAVTTLFDEENGARDAAAGDFSRDFFGKRANLTVSGQLAGETYACALTNIYTFGPTFRAENSNTSRHLSEFWMIEPEMAFCDLEGDMELAEEYVRALVRSALERCGDDLAFFNERHDKELVARLERIAESSFERISYTDAIAALEKSGKTFEFPVKWGNDLQSEHERWLVEQHAGRPVVVFDYPKEIKAFYMRLNDDERTVAAMDVLLPGVGELIGGSQREERPDVLRRRLEESGLDSADYWWYLDLRRYGTVPHAGFGLGFERAVQFVAALDNIRDAIPFPRVPGNAEF